MITIRYIHTIHSPVFLILPLWPLLCMLYRLTLPSLPINIKTNTRLWPTPSSPPTLFSICRWSHSWSDFNQIYRLTLSNDSLSSPGFSFVLHTFHPIVSLASLLFLKISNTSCPQTQPLGKAIKSHKRGSQWIKHLAYLEWFLVKTSCPLSSVCNKWREGPHQKFT